MKSFDIQMIDWQVDSSWWDQIIKHFLGLGDSFEIRCWKEEIEEISLASSFKGSKDAQVQGNELSIKGHVTEDLIENLLSDKPRDKDIYNKMTRFFTINFKNSRCNLSSAHYGTEMYIDVFSKEDAAFLENLMNTYKDFFSISEV